MVEDGFYSSSKTQGSWDLTLSQDLETWNLGHSVKPVVTHSFFPMKCSHHLHPKENYKISIVIQMVCKANSWGPRCHCQPINSVMACPRNCNPPGLPAGIIFFHQVKIIQYLGSGPPSAGFTLVIPTLKWPLLLERNSQCSSLQPYLQDLTIVMSSLPLLWILLSWQIAIKYLYSKLNGLIIISKGGRKCK